MSKQITPPELTQEEAGLWGMSEYEYHGPVVYLNGRVETVRFPGGYATIKDSEVTFHYYKQDCLGNNRAVINGSTGAVEQTVAYYPYGAVIADIGTTSDPQPYKFGGKKLTLHNGLNEYDFGARQYYPAVPHFTSVDPLCEKYYWLSPYLYCANNPVNAVDTDGKLIIFVNGFHFGDGGSSRYWNGIDKQIMNKIGDNKAIYYDGSIGGVRNTIFSRMDDDQNLNVKHRISAGYEAGYTDFESILMNAEDETIKFVTHSMGSAYAKGMISGMMARAKDEGIDLKDKISFEVDFAPFQPFEQYNTPRFSDRHNYGGMTKKRYICKKEENQNGKTIEIYSFFQGESRRGSAQGNGASGVAGQEIWRGTLENYRMEERVA